MVKNRLQELREKYKMTQDEIGEILGVSRGQIYRYEALENAIPVDKAIVICNYFNVSLGYFFYRDEINCIDNAYTFSTEALETIKTAKRLFQEEIAILEEQEQIIINKTKRCK